MISRPRKVRVVSGVCAVVFLSAFAAVAILLKNTPTGVFFTTSDQVAMMGIGVLLALGALWGTYPKVSADDEGIDVRNMLGTTRYHWDAVEGVSFPDGAAWARLELPDDEYVPIMAVQAMDGDRAVEAIRDLRRLHRASAHAE
ncbi:MAG: PH domain-containing protein [Actinomycetota bacterium]|nr:PH domain-containing protein [Actinomycetota bacterium]